MIGDWNKKEHWAPFCKKTGGMFSWANTRNELLCGPHCESAEWKEVSEPIRLDLKYKDYEKGRSAMIFWFSNIAFEEQEFPVTIKYMDEILKSGKLTDESRIWGLFKVVKHGSNYGIAYVNE